jgi:hypothetical protein
MQSGTFKSKSFWTGLAMIVTGAGMCAVGDLATGIQTIAGGLVTIFVRDAIAKLGGTSN